MPSSKYRGNQVRAAILHSLRLPSTSKYRARVQTPKMLDCCGIRRCNSKTMIGTLEIFYWKHFRESPTTPGIGAPPHLTAAIGCFNSTNHSQDFCRKIKTSIDQQWMLVTYGVDSQNHHWPVRKSIVTGRISSGPAGAIHAFIWHTFETILKGACSPSGGPPNMFLMFFPNTYGVKKSCQASSQTHQI